MATIYFIALCANFGLGWYCHWKYGPKLKQWFEETF